MYLDKNTTQSCDVIAILTLESLPVLLGSTARSQSSQRLNKVVSDANHVTRSRKAEHQHVLCFQVTVDDSTAMEVLQPRCYLRVDKGSMAVEETLRKRSWILMLEKTKGRTTQ